MEGQVAVTIFGVNQLFHPAGEAADQVPLDVELKRP